MTVFPSPSAQPRIRDTAAQDQVLSASPRSRLRRWLLPVAGAFVALALLAWTVSSWAGGSRSYAGARIRIAEVVRGDLVRDIAAEGRVISANSPTLYAIAGGTVALQVVAGDQVKEGQPLAEIDSPELRSRLVQEESTLASLEAEANRSTLDAQIVRTNARKLVEQAEVERMAAQRDVERYERAFEGGAVAEFELARAQDRLKNAQIALDSAKEDFGLQSRGSGLDTRNRQLLAERQQAVVDELRRQVEALTLRSPFDGQVGQVQVDQRSNVAANAPVLTVVDLSEFEVEIRVPESFARDLGIGMPAEVRSANQTYPAEVSAVSPEVVNGEVATRLRFSGEQPPRLRQNQRLSARVLLDSRPNVLMVERGPFLDQTGSGFAYVVNGSRAERRPITTGAFSLRAVEITGGVSEGERIVVSGSELFEGADQVRISGQ